MNDPTVADAVRETRPAPLPVWHPLVELARVTASAPVPVPVALDGVPWAVAILDGDPTALHDVCPHRRVPLSAGRVTAGPVGDVLECGYHGWSYDRQGGCARIPALGEGVVPRGMGSVRVLRTGVFAGIVWGATDDSPEPPAAADVVALHEQSFDFPAHEADALLGGVADPSTAVRRGLDVHGPFSYAVRVVDAKHSAIFPLVAVDSIPGELATWTARLSLFPDSPLCPALSPSEERLRDAR